MAVKSACSGGSCIQAKNTCQSGRCPVYGSSNTVSFSKAENNPQTNINTDTVTNYQKTKQSQTIAPVTNKYF